MNPCDYNIAIRRTHIDGEDLFEARVRELPDVTEYAESYQEAYELALDTIETTVEVLTEQGRPYPEPAAVVDEYSGRVTLRLPRTLHRRLAQEAEHDGVSLNQYLVALLGYHAGTCFRRHSDRSQDWRPAPAQHKAKPRDRGHLQLIGRTDTAAADGWQDMG